MANVSQVVTIDSADLGQHIGRLEQFAAPAVAGRVTAASRKFRPPDIPPLKRHAGVARRCIVARAPPC